MTDSAAQTDDPTEGLVKKIGKRLRKYFEIRRERAELKLDHDKKAARLTAKFEKADEPLAKHQAELEAEIRALIVPNRVALMSGKLKSFATAFGLVSLTWKPASFTITDPKGLEQQARKDGDLKRLGKFKRTWSPTAKLVIDMMKSDTKRAKRYGPYVQPTGGFDELFVQPNETYYTDYDPNQLTPKSVNLGQVTDDTSQDESPDA